MTEFDKLSRTLFHENKVGDIKVFAGEDRRATEEEISEEVNRFFARLRHA